MENNEDLLKKINILREQVNDIDNHLVELLAKRKGITNELIQQKIDAMLPVLDKQREREIISKHIQNIDIINETFLNKFFHLLFEDSKRQYYKYENLFSIHDYICRRPIIIAGPCVVENELQINTIAEKLSSYGIKFLRGGSFKPRTSPNSFQGLGNEGVKLLSEAAKKNNMYSVTEILEIEQLVKNYELIDVVQIGSRSMTSYGLLKSVGNMTAKDGKYVLLKRGFSATLSEFLNAADYILQAGNPNVILCLRGIRTFEQIDSNLRFTPDLASILELRGRTELPVIFDPSHSTGKANFVVDISNAALNIGADGLIIEVHNQPSTSEVDAMQAIIPEKILDII